jgi:D-3-phosphoglycerate dehydrogenase
MTVCVIAQPIHPIGAQLLSQAGIKVLQAPSADLSSLRSVIGPADAVIVRDQLPADVIDLAPHLAVIANHGTGYDKVDVVHATAVGIPVVYTPLANVRSVAEHALMLMLSTARQAVAADTATRRGDWGFKYTQPMCSLYGKTLGLVGWGYTARLLCAMAKQALNMRIVVWSPSADVSDMQHFGVEPMPTLKDLLHVADVVSLHRPLRADTKHTIDADALNAMQSHAILINTARGGLVDEPALVAALNQGKIFGAGLDVFETEPLPMDAPIAQCRNVVLTPHVAGSTQEALHETAKQCAEQIIAVLSGQKPANLIRPAVWEQRKAPRAILSSGAAV